MMMLTVGSSINGVLRGIIIGHILGPLANFISNLYKLIMDLAETQIIEGQVVYNIFNRIQLIIAVFMIFRLMITIIQMIISPESGKNDEGATKGGTKFSIIIKRILLGLILIVLLRPTNISAPTGNASGENRLNQYVHNNGIIFGVLYELQYRILHNNNIPCIISGGDLCDSDNSSSSDEEDGHDGATQFSDFMIKAFVTPNLKEKEANPEDTENWICNDGDNEEIINEYLDQDKKIEASRLLEEDFYKASCVTQYHFGMFNDEVSFTFNYNYIILLLVLIAMAYILVGFIIDIGIRSIKLVLLRLISPIPVISYMSNEKDQILSNWVKNLINTYVDLFVRLAFLFLSLDIIATIANSGGTVYTNGDNDLYGVLVKIAISISLLIFAKMAPKYVMDILGIKGTGASNLGLSSLMGGTARLLGGGGLSGFASGAMTTLDSSTDAISQGKAAPGAGNAFRQNSDLQARIRTGDKEAHGGLSGKLLDRMNFQNRERAADKLGIGSKDYAKASYVNDMNKKDMKAAEEEMNEAQSALSKFQKNGNKMTRNQLAKEYGLSGDDLESAYSQYSSQYDAAAKRVNEAKAKYKTASDAYAKSNKNVERMDKERQAMNVLPRISDTEKDHSPKKLPGKAGELQEKFLENTKVGQAYTAVRDSKAVGAVKDFVYYREPEQVVTDESGFAIDSNGERTIEPSDYQYERNNKGYQGAVDETTFINLNGGPPGGAPPGP